MPQLVYSIWRIMSASWVGPTRARMRKLACGTLKIIQLPWDTTKQIWAGNTTELKMYEVFFESYPQLTFALYLVCIRGFGEDTLTVVMKALAMLTSLISVVMGINSSIVEDYFQTAGWRSVVRCWLYTLPDLLLRLIIYPITWLLLGTYSIIFHLLQILLSMIVLKCLAGYDWTLTMINSLVGCICPQAIFLLN